MDINDTKVEWLGHATFKISNDKVIYIDPFKLKGNEEKADLILISHEHFDHCDRKEIDKIMKSGTIIITHPNCRSKLEGNVDALEAGQRIKFNGVNIETVEAYNINKFKSEGVPYHAKGDGLGFIIEIGGIRIYHTGDSDFIPEMRNINNIDVMLVPVGGTYTMDEEEASRAVNYIKPRVVIPMHYNSLDGLNTDLSKFKELVKNIKIEEN